MCACLRSVFVFGKEGTRRDAMAERRPSVAADTAGAAIPLRTPMRRPPGAISSYLIRPTLARLCHYNGMRVCGQICLVISARVKSAAGRILHLHGISRHNLVLCSGTYDGEQFTLRMYRCICVLRGIFYAIFYTIKILYKRIDLFRNFSLRDDDHLHYTLSLGFLLRIQLHHIAWESLAILLQSRHFGINFKH